MLDYTNAEIAFSNGWRYGAPIPKGDITMNDLWNIIPVNPYVSVAELKGEEIWDMIEENIERTFSSNPYQQMGGYLKRAYGMNVYFKIENKFKNRVQQIFINNEEIHLKKNYKVSYVTSQGVPKKYCINHKHLELRAIDVIKGCLEKHSPIDSSLVKTYIPI